MGFWTEYNPDFGIVFDEWDDAINAALGGASGGGGKSPPAPAPNTQKPAGVEVSPGRVVSPNGLTTYLYQPSTGWTASPYPPSAADKQAAGIGGNTASSPRIDYTAQRSQQQIASGGSQTPPQGAYLITPTRAVDRSGLTVWTKDPTTNNWTNAGFPPNNADRQAAARVALADRQSGSQSATSRVPTQQTSSTPGNLPVSNPLQGNQAPLLSSFSNFTTPGAQISADNRRTMYTGNEMNTLVRTPNGPQLPAFLPAGRRPEGGGNINNYMFTPSSTSPAYAQFPNTAFSVPGDYVASPSGYRDSGYFSPVDIPFGITGPTATSPGGAGTLTLSGPQNVNISNADRSVGYGYVTSPFAYNSIGAAYGRNLSDDAATRAVETAMLLNAQQKYGPEGAMALLTRPDPGVYTGQPGLYGNMALEGNGTRTDYGWIFGGADTGDYSPMERYAKGGSVATAPLGKPDQVTNEPIIAFGAYSGKPKFMAGEDNADPDTRPNPELITIEPLKRYAEGGAVATGEIPIDPGGIVMTATPSSSTSVDSLANTLAGPYSEIPQSSYTAPVVSPAPVFDPLDPNILQPWQQAAQRNAQMQHLRDTVDEPRRRAAGFVANSATGIPVYAGDIPATPLGAGEFYDTSPQVNRTLNAIVGAQDEFRNLAPLIDTNPLYTREGEIETSLGLFDRIRQLELQRVGAAATDSLAKANAQLELNALNADLAAAQNTLQGLIPLYQSAVQQLNSGAGNPEYAGIVQSYLDQVAKVAGIQTNIAQTQNRLNTASPELTSLDSLLTDIRNQTQGLNEGSLLTERGLLRAQLSNNQSRLNKEIDLRTQLQNLAKAGVPKLNQPILPVTL